MKPIFFLFSLMIFFCQSCKNDDDGGSVNDTIIGSWTLQSESDTTAVGCNNNITTLEFFETRNATLEVEVNSLIFLQTNCKDVALGDYTGDGKTGTVTFLRMQGDNFIPPPKNDYTYSRNGNKLTLTTTIQGIVFEYEKN